MPAAKLAPREIERLAALRSYQILDSKPERTYDDIVQIAACICDTPIALISLVDESRQWFKARVGLDALETPRDQAFCAHTILGPIPLVVADARNDPRFDDNPLVTGDPQIRFYAGVPLFSADGLAIGTLCAIDNKERRLTQGQVEALVALGRQVIANFEARKTAAQLAAALDKIKSIVELLPVCAWCKKVQSESGKWDTLEAYLTQITDIEFTHGICAPCRVHQFPPKSGD